MEKERCYRGVGTEGRAHRVTAAEREGSCKGGEHRGHMEGVDSGGEGEQHGRLQCAGQLCRMHLLAPLRRWPTVTPGLP